MKYFIHSWPTTVDRSILHGFLWSSHNPSQLVALTTTSSGCECHQLNMCCMKIHFLWLVLMLMPISRAWFFFFVTVTRRGKIPLPTLSSNRPQNSLGSHSLKHRLSTQSMIWSQFGQYCLISPFNRITRGVCTPACMPHTPNIHPSVNHMGDGESLIPFAPQIKYYFKVKFKLCTNGNSDISSSHEVVEMIKKLQICMYTCLTEGLDGPIRWYCPYRA